MEMFIGALGMFGAILCGITAYHSYTNDDILGGVEETVFAIVDILIASYWFTV